MAMSYRAFKRLLGETSLERKCRFLFGGFILLLITASFWLYAQQTYSLAYAQIAPDAPHAQHMPSHIFTRVGAWRESVASNTRAFAAALPGREFSEAQHASDYMVYAALQLARDKAAQAAVQAAFAVTVPPPVPPATFYARAAMPARLSVPGTATP